DIILQYTIKPNLYGTFVATFLKIPVINNISGLGTVFLKDKFVYKFARVLYKIILRFPKKIFFQNQHDYDMFVEKKIVKSNLCDVIPGSGINSDKFSPQKKKDSSSLSVTFLMIARLIKDKGIIEYIDAVKILKRKYPNTKFQLIGSLYPGNPSAISKEMLDGWIDSNYIEYLDFSDDMEQIISKVDCVTLPSYREGLSRVLLESASMAKPIVTTDVVGCRDVVEHGVNGFLCEVKNANSLAMEMEKIILMTPQERTEMGNRGRERVIGKFDEKIVIEKYLNSISKILNKKVKKEFKVGYFN
ncbi:glycosyltransferase family 4 protein, partial [Sulfurovum sp. bin170]|uniref:glycosyltransferase family 4 protein n=1 Tax=Sulfurovum sp. bin170 TaxID=2695268 RepID=UPI0013DF1DEF